MSGRLRHRPRRTVLGGLCSLFDGCPTVRLSDSPEDLAHFLRVLLPGSQKRFYCRDASAALSFDEVSAVIRLAHKYHVADIQNQGLLLLQDHYFPSDFDRYEELRKGHSLPRNLYGIAAINLARLTNTPSLLPVAFLKCHSLREAVLDGQKRADGTVEHLSPDDLRRCFVAQSALLERNSQAMGSVFQPKPSDTCNDPARCRRGLGDSCNLIVRKGTVFQHDFIINWAKLIELAGQSICPECEKELQARNAKERRKVWDDLPKIFGITVEGWSNCGAAD
ncbi:hypothetical protein GSI_12313 [Ganoderma sinense ZZ0214-1]|uniref:BTB domain-containing protein n=1 Tax=Ganoderma sinense ZZ0214-1 TaxID=1077348 RepID=A0A2G8RYH3_9APHY|nr:hypothetical protein GSI_12313 [Ganoderma sinense ZZ0214-1]